LLSDGTANAVFSATIVRHRRLRIRAGAQCVLPNILTPRRCRITLNRWYGLPPASGAGFLCPALRSTADQPCTRWAVVSGEQGRRQPNRRAQSSLSPSGGAPTRRPGESSIALPPCYFV